MSNRRMKRRRLLIDGSQRRLMGIYLVHFFVIVAIMFVAMVFVFNRQLAYSGLSELHRQQISNRILWVYGQWWPFLWGVLTLLFVHAVYLTNKIAGPLYQIRRALARVREGDLTVTVRTRSGDYLKGETENVNAVIALFRDRLETLHLLAGSADQTLSDVRRAIDRGSAEDTRTHLDELTSNINGLRTALAFFRVSQPKDAQQPAAVKSPGREDLTPVA